MTPRRPTARPRRPTFRLWPIHRQRHRQIPEEIEALVDLLGRRVRTGHQEAGPTGERHALELTPRLEERPTGRHLGGALVDEHDGARPPDRGLLPQRPDPGAELVVAGL